jgi:hypothetical protein
LKLAHASRLLQFNDMTIDAIQQARDTAPFKPFVIRTADGQGFEVPNHDSLLVAEGDER